MQCTGLEIKPELDDALLRRAWRLLRPLTWPDSFEETMQDALRARQVHMFAAQLLRSDARVNQSEAPPPVARVTPDRRRSLWVARAPASFDGKRAAAGDRDD